MKILFTLIILFFSLNIFSQNLTLDEVMNLRKKSIANCEEYLTSKNWNLISSKSGKKDYKLGNLIFAYNKNPFDDNAESFIYFYYSDFSDRKRIKIQLIQPQIYNNYIDRIKSFRCKLIDNKVNDDGIVKTYQGATTTFIITISTPKDVTNSTSSTLYYFLIIDNSDYELNYN